MLSKRYESTEVDRRTWLHVPLNMKSLSCVLYLSVLATCVLKYEVSISYGSKVIAKVKDDNRQTDRLTNKQTERQEKNNMPPIIRSGGIKRMAPDVQKKKRVVVLR